MSPRIWVTAEYIGERYEINENMMDGKKQIHAVQKRGLHHSR